MRKINKERPGGATETASPYSCTYSVRIKKFVGMVVSMFLIWVTVEEALAAFEDPTVSTTRTSQGQPAENRCRQKNYPGPENFEQGHIRNMTLTFYHEKRFEDGLKFVLSQTELGLTEEVREFYLALFYERLEKREEALEHCRRVCELDPAFFETREMEAQLNFDLKRYEVALERYTAIVELFPERETVYLGMAWLLMDMAKPLDALEMVNRALNKGLTGERLLALKRQLSRMIDGPVWPEGRKISDFKSNHYHVISDLGRRRCFEITKQLEEAFVSFKVNFKHVKRTKKEKFKVVVFRDKEDFIEYNNEIFEEEPPFKVVGVYSHRSRQLLLVNLTNTYYFESVLRHEGFHQYFHELVKNTPLWLDEGLAVYFQHAEKVRGRWKLDRITRAHRYHCLNELRGTTNDWMPLDRFLFQNRGEFYQEQKKTGLSYARSYAFVYFLLHSTRKNKKIFDTLINSLQRGVPSEKAISKAFGAVDLLQLDKDFRSFAREL